MIRPLLAVLAVLCCAGFVSAADTRVETLGLRLSILTPLPYRNVPIDPDIDFAGYIRQARAKGVLDPNSIEVIDAANGERVSHALSETFAHEDRGRVEFVVHQPDRREYRIQFRTAPVRPPLKPQKHTPLIGTGDLLRANAGESRPITLAYSMAVTDLNNDGAADLAGTWNYFRRPGEFADSVVCYPGLKKGLAPEFGDLVELRYTEGTQAASKSFSHIYAATDFADLNHDGRIDLVYTKSGSNAAEFFLNTGRLDAGGFPRFAPAGSVEVPGWQACRLVDLTQDGVLDLVVDGNLVPNTNRAGWPFKPAPPGKLDAGRQPCFLDVNHDGRPDAICLRGNDTLQPDFYRIAWRPNEGGVPPTFGAEQLLQDIDVPHCSAVSTYALGAERGLIVQHDALETLTFFRLTDGAGEPTFERRGRAESISAPLAFGDQATPCLCDWDADGDLDLLIGGGHGWPQIVLNKGTPTQPRFAEPQFILANGKPIRFLRNEILGEPRNWHDMGYTFPIFADWDADGRADLIFPNETNRIFWYPNSGTPQAPRFEERREILCDGYPDSPELRALSARRANVPKSPEGVYPREREQPFFWRTGAAAADFNGDGLMDLATLDGFTRALTLFTQYRLDDQTLRLRKSGALKLGDGRAIDDQIVGRAAHWTESFRAIDWDRDGLLDLIYSVAGAHRGTKDGGSIYLLRNVGSKQKPEFAPPSTMRCFGQPIRFTNHGPHPWPGDLDGDGNADLVGYVEWSVYPFFSYAALSMPNRPQYELKLLN
jgi:hypothetical protein